MSDDSGDESDELGSNPLGGLLDDDDGDVSNSYEEANSSIVEDAEMDEEKNAEDIRRDALKLFTSMFYRTVKVVYSGQRGTADFELCKRTCLYGK